MVGLCPERSERRAHSKEDPPPYEEADSFGQAVSRDGFFKTAINDANQYGPVGMMILLFIVATITGAAIKLLESFELAEIGLVEGSVSDIFKPDLNKSST